MHLYIYWLVGTPTDKKRKNGFGWWGHRPIRKKWFRLVSISTDKKKERNGFGWWGHQPIRKHKSIETKIPIHA